MPEPDTEDPHHGRPDRIVQPGDEVWRPYDHDDDEDAAITQRMPRQSEAEPEP